MIPQHLIDKAAKAIRRRASFQAWRGEGYPPEVLALAALEAVAADIWGDGFEVGEFNGYAIGRGIETSEDTTNPYIQEVT